jgi:hypothetical protein
MRRRRSKWWWVAAAGVSALLLRWGCSACSSSERIETTIHVKLATGVTASSAKLDKLDVDGDAKVIEQTDVFMRSEAMLQNDRAQAAALSHEAMPDLTAWKSLRIKGTKQEIERAVAKLRERKDVESAFEVPKAELPYVREEGAKVADGDSCPIKTPNYREQQGYLDPAPGGINAPFAWKEKGGRGNAVWFADVEGAWNVKHEDLPGDRIKQLGRDMGRDWEMHGTAVLGEVVAKDNGMGMLGIAPDVAKVVTSSISGISAAAAIDRAQAELRKGDVLLIELHAIGPRGRFLPMEFWDDVFDVLKIATARGVVVIEAAGNGAEDLDHETYKGKLDRRTRDSGAIMVGAGAPLMKGWTDRSRLDFSNYGTRVDVQGWGRMVATNDYGDLQGCDANGRKYTKLFAGTSSASPIVAGAALLVESIMKTEKRCALDPKDLRKVLIDTGSPQTDGPHGPVKQHIGPRPDLKRAIDRARAVPCTTADFSDD